MSYFHCLSLTHTDIKVKLFLFSLKIFYYNKMEEFYIKNQNN